MVDSGSDSPTHFVMEDDVDEATTLEAAFEKKVRPYIDLVDELRRLGLDQDISLPSVIVIGDQSSGKSSILEAISGIQLPRGSGIVTRCPLEMQLKKTTDLDKGWCAHLRYKPMTGPERDIRVDNPEELEKKIRTAQNEIAGENKGISDKLITLRVESPTCPDLTLIDLPGIARVAVEDQPRDICDQIKYLLKSFMEKENTVMLCVIPSNVDIAVNEALSLSREIDQDGLRTLGVLTKPDLVDAGTEDDVLSILNNERYTLENGYSIVRCRGQMDINEDMNLEQALEQEENFFKRHHKFRLTPEEQRGTRNLALKLTDNLVKHIQRTLPKLREDVRYKLEMARKKLATMSDGPPSAAAEKRLYLMRLIDSVLKEMEETLIRGNQVPSSVVLKLKKDHNTLKCNTALLWRSRFEEFRDKVGELTENSFKREGLTIPALQEKLNYYRGRELPRFINFDLFETLVKEHISHYSVLSEECLTSVSNDLLKIIEYVCKERLQHVPSVQGHIRGICEDCRTECKEKGKELLQLEMEKEQLVYTQDRTYVTELKRLEQKLAEAANENGRRQKKQSMSFQLTAHEEDEEFENNAEVMQQLIKVYIDVANRRIQDNIPMLIRTTQHHQYLARLRERLQNVVAGENVDELVQEDPKCALDRRQLEDKCKRLAAAMKRLNYTCS